MKRFLFLILLMTILQYLSYAQDLSGFWKGNLGIPGSCFSENNIEIQIEASGNEVFGDSYHYQDIDYYVKKDVRGNYNQQTKNLIIQEGDVTTFKIPDRCIVCIKKYDLTYSKEGNIETLRGIWTGKVMGTNRDCESGYIILTRTSESAFKEIPEVLIDTGDLRLDFYDNGEIDGDSITVRVNKRVVLSNQLLGPKPVTIMLRIDLQNTFQEVEMVAENEGSIPPNTALLIVTAGDKRYRLFLTSTEEKSARVRFVYSPGANHSLK